MDTTTVPEGDCLRGLATTVYTMEDARAGVAWEEVTLDKLIDELELETGGKVLLRRWGHYDSHDSLEIRMTVPPGTTEFGDSVSHQILELVVMPSEGPVSIALGAVRIPSSPRYNVERFFNSYRRLSPSPRSRPATP